MKKSWIIVISLIGLIGLISLIVIKKNSTPTPTVEEEIVLPINAIPVEERPFVTLTPDQSGRNLTLSLDNTAVKEIVEYELVYQSGDKQEGAFGRLDLTRETLPVEKEILLGSQSGGGKITYHEGVTGGSLTFTYGETKLKEQFNFLRFDPADPVLTSPDGRFAISLTKTALVNDSVVVIMKTFGLPAVVGLPAESAKLLAGPYTYQPSAAPKGAVSIEFKLPAGQHTNPTIHAYDASEQAWTPLKTTLEGDAVSATPANAGYVFVVINQ